MITIVGKDDEKLGEAVAVADKYVPVNATKLKLASAGKLKTGDTVVVRRPSTTGAVSVVRTVSSGRGSWSISRDTGSRRLSRTATS